MSIHILYDFKPGPFGGANQFLKNLRDFLREQDLYEADALKADYVLINSHTCGCSKSLVTEIIRIVKKNPEVIIIHRIDGPVSRYQSSNTIVDKLVHTINRIFADATIFQTKYCFDENKDLGYVKTSPVAIIKNTPNRNIFYNRDIQSYSEKVRVAISTWSDYINKGFDAYVWLDEHLDFERFEVTLIGNTPREFKNINHIPPVPSEELAKILNEHDIYLSASRKEACSNAIIEAIACGLPVVARNDGGNPEVVAENGELFDRHQQIPELLEKIANNPSKYTKKQRGPDAPQRYLEFIQAAEKIKDPKGYFGLRILFYKWKLKTLIRAIRL